MALSAIPELFLLLLTTNHYSISYSSIIDACQVVDANSGINIIHSAQPGTLAALPLANGCVCLG